MKRGHVLIGSKRAHTKVDKAHTNLNLTWSWPGEREGGGDEVEELIKGPI